MDKKLDSIIDYFAIFGYFPSFEDVYTFFPEKISEKRLKNIFEAKKYTPPQYSIKKIQKSKFKSQNLNSKVKSKNNETMEQWNNPIERKQISKSKLNSLRFKLYIKLLSIFPQIRLIGLSGSISMMNAKEDDDIDLFVITARNRLFTGRFIALVLAQMLGLRRKRDSASQFLSHESLTSAPRGPLESEKIVSSSSADYKNQVCLNLFFDESNLKVPVRKQTLFVGHEVLQMKPIINKHYTYERFLTANLWVTSIFPNTAGLISKIKDQRSKNSSKFKSLIFKFVFDIGTLIFDLFEQLTKKLQLILINRHRTTEIITSSQLWFHPDDFEKKINSVR